MLTVSPTMPLRYLTKCYSVATARQSHQEANETYVVTHLGAHLVDVNSQGEQEQLVAWAAEDMDVTQHNEIGPGLYEVSSRRTIEDQHMGVYTKLRVPIYAVVLICVAGLAVLALLSVQIWYTSVLSNKVDQLTLTCRETCGSGSSPPAPSAESSFAAMFTPTAPKRRGSDSTIAAISTPPTTEVGCPPTMPLRYLTECYSVVTAHQTNQEANETCTATHSGAHLVDVNSQGEQEQLGDWAEMNNMTNIWTSGVRQLLVSGTSDEFMWSNSNSALDYTNWLAGEPNDEDGLEDCLHLWSARNWGWNDEECSDKFPSICEYP